MTEFDRATAVAPAGDGAYAAAFDDAWNVQAGPNGGYVAAIVLRAMVASLDGAARRPRSLTLHYLRPPQPGEARVEVAVERAGRGLTTLSGRVVQSGNPTVLALAAFAAEYPSVLDYATPPPDAPPADAVDPDPRDHPALPAIARRVETRTALGRPPFSRAGEAVLGGWLRLADPRPLDDVLLALYTDAWLPAPFARLDRPSPAPTIDLTIHFRAPAPAGDGDGLVLTRVRSTTSAGGFFEEDAEIWAPDGTLLAQSRQLALLLPLPAG